MKKIYLLTTNTEKAREKKAKESGYQIEEISWNDVHNEELKKQIFDEALPVKEMLEQYVEVVHVVIFDNTCYVISMTEEYVQEFICYIVVDKLEQDDSYLLSLANNLSKIIDERYKNSMLEDIKNLAKKQYALLGKNDKRTLEDLQDELVEKFDLA